MRQRSNSMKTHRKRPLEGPKPPFVWLMELSSWHQICKFPNGWENGRQEPKPCVSTKQLQWIPFRAQVKSLMDALRIGSLAASTSSSPTWWPDLMASITAERLGGKATRCDLTGKWPDLDENEDGDLMDPTDEEFKKIHKEVRLSQHTNKRDLARDDFEDFRLASEGAKIIREILKYFINCGWTISEIKRALGASDEGKAMVANRHQYTWGPPEYQKWRKHGWEDLQRHSSLVRRAIAGTLDVTSYTYLRPEPTYSSTKYLNPLAIVLALKEADRTIAVSHILQNYMVEMNDALVAQLEKGKDRSRKKPGCAPGWGALLEEGLLKSICNVPSGSSTS